MNVGRVYGINIKINYCFFIIAGLFSLSGMGKEVIIVFCSVIFHEIAHVVMARYCSYKVSEIEILPFGGAAKIERFWERDKKKIFLTAAIGPISSLCLGVLCLLLNSIYGSYCWQVIGDVNIILAWFNLLPAFPLDGGHIVRVIFMNFFSYKKSTQYLAVISCIVIFLMTAKIFYDIIFFRFVNISVGILILFIYAAIKSELKNSEFYTVKLMAYKKSDLLKQGCMETAHYTVLKNTKIKLVTNLFAAERYTVIIVIDEMYHIRGMFTEIEVWEALGEKGICTTFADLLL